MSIYRKVQAVERLYHNLEKDVATFQKATDLKCKSGCGMCCLKPDIAASPLEFLPLAYHLFKNGQALEWLEKAEKSNSKICINLNSLIAEENGGFCNLYTQRGLICRLFGFSAMLGKDRKPQLVTCKTIKEIFPEAVDKANQHIKERKFTPVISHYYQQLRSIDAELGQNSLPINKAIAQAIRTVLAYYAYRNPRRAG
ncbi:YkgJ family cysteine cluster protein [Ekhidna sp.]|uniref:YkgJ family cysteine cluster protein n=1 Tax=Ekhidna sp. TaxID=2608089 RepID=UPI003B596D2C